MTLISSQQEIKKTATREFDFSWPRSVQSAPTLDQDPFVANVIEGLPTTMLEAYARVAVTHAVVEEMEEGEYFAEVFGLTGVWGSGPSAGEARVDLESSIVEWVILRRRSGLHIPPMDGWDLNPVVAFGELAS